MKRVLVIGSGGAGKSTFSRRLAANTGLPLVHLDLLYWHSGWVPTDHATWDTVIATQLQRDAWVMDGNYGRTLPARLAAADTVIFLDMPRWLCLWRLLKRRLQYAFQPREDLPDGCAERLTLEFIVWVWQYPVRRRAEILARLASLRPDQRAVILTSTHAADTFLAQLTSAGAASQHDGPRGVD